MRSFYLVYGILLLSVSVAFSYLESRSKDQRILNAKISHANKLVQNQDCAKAFNLLTQINQASLSGYYSNLTQKDIQKLQGDLCEALKKVSDAPGAIHPKKLSKPSENGNASYRVKLSHSSGESASELIFKRKKGELILTKVDP
jgi:hypothetical protein